LESTQAIPSARRAIYRRPRLWAIGDGQPQMKSCGDW